MRELRPPTVLVVDDDLDVRAAVCEVLARAGHRVLGVSNGSEALSYLYDAAVLPRVIVLDMCMPVMDGPEFRSLQVQDTRLAVIPVVVVSATEVGDAMMADAWYPKPYRVDELVSTVGSLAAAR